MENIEPTKNENAEKKLEPALYIISGMSFIPTFGLLFALISIVLGTSLWKKGGKLVLTIGVSSILLHVAYYLFISSLFYKEKWDEGLMNLSRSGLIRIVQSIEYYKLQNDHYPDNLDILKKKYGTISADPILMDIRREGSHYYFYELGENNKSYKLFSVGPDGKPFTDDDILPEIDGKGRSKIGLKTYKIK